MEIYKKLLKIKESTRLDYFVMAVTYFFDIGYQASKQLDESDFKEAKANGIMTKDFVEWLMRTAKQIADIVESPVELVQFCMTEDIFTIEYFSGKLPRWKLEDMINARMTQEKYTTDDKEDLDKLCELYNCTPDYFEELGYNLPDDYEEE